MITLTYQELEKQLKEVKEEKEKEKLFREALDHEFIVNAALLELYKPLISPTSTIDEITVILLEKARALTRSQHGYVSATDLETGDNVGYTLTHMLDNCDLPEDKQKIIFPIGPDGKYPALWGHALNTHESFFTNTPSQHPASKGPPAGHIPVERFLSVPVMLGAELVGQVALANKETDYTVRDLETIQRLAGYYALAIQRMRAQEALEQVNDKLEIRVRERTAELEAANQQLSREIKERIQAVEEREQMMNELRRTKKLEAIGTLAGGIAHDFNNILAAIIGYSELAQYKIPQDNEALSDLDEVLKAANRAKELVRQILTFSRQGAREQKPILLKTVVNEAVKLLRAIIPASIQIIQDIDPICDEHTILGDPTQVHQVIMNLGTNAYQSMHFQETGAILKIEIMYLETQEVNIIRGVMMEPGKYIEIKVSDTGQGMAPEVLERIFDPYFTTREIGQGMGLGLSVVHGIVKSHKGYITVESQIGKGSTFYIYFPCHDSHMEIEEIPVGVQLPIGNERILYVDDEEALVKTGKAILERFGYRVTGVSDSKEALEIFRENPDNFDLLITDMTMPGMTGARLAQELLKIKPGIPMIICTGYSDSVEEETAKSLGFREFIMKPIMSNKIALLIRKVLDK